MAIEFASSTTQINQFLDQYNFWCISKIIGTTREPVAVNSNAGIPCFDYRNIDAINNCKEPIIAIDSVAEGASRLILAAYRQYTPGPHYIIFSSAEWDPAKVNLPISYTLVSHIMKWWIYSRGFIVTDQSYSSFMYIDRYRFDYPKKTLFNLTIGAKLTDRDYVVNQIQSNINHKNYILKYSGKILENPNDFSDSFINDDYQGADKTSSKLIGNGFENSNKLKFDHNINSIANKIPTGIYNQTYFTLVSETNQDNTDGQDLFFITDKFLKPTAMGSPTVIISTPGYLKKLRKYGFETWGNLWDESYDEEPDFEKRVSKVIDLCNQLQTFDWEAHREQLEFISCKNIRNFMFCRLDQVMENFELVMKGLANG